MKRLFVLLAACTEPQEPPIVEDPPIDIGLDDGKADVDVSTLGNGGDLFINQCQASGATLVCSPFRMRIAPGGKTVTTKLPEVTQAITHTRIQPGLIARQGLVGSTVDQAGRRVFWHADCDPSYHVTNIDTGVTSTFAIDRVKLGIFDDGRGFCLNEWAWDEHNDRAIAIAGRQDRSGGLANEKSSLDFVLALDASGNVEILHDLRTALDFRLRFLHEFQTIASLDRDREEFVAPVITPPSSEDQVLVNIRTGSAQLIGGGGARVHRFFDVATRKQTALDCNITGFTSALVGETNPRVAISRTQLEANGINECIPGFTGGGYDPVGTKDFLLMREQQITPNGVFFLGVADMTNNRWLGIVKTDLSYGAFGVADVTASQRLFLMTEFVPARSGGSSVTIVEGATRQFQTTVVPAGTYTITTTGVGDIDLDVGNCSSRTLEANESCTITLAAPDRIRATVRGVKPTSTFRITARK